jgi:hypothetical protein
MEFNTTEDNEWLMMIEGEIKDKYGIKNPVFKYNFKEFDSRQCINNWMDKCEIERRLIKYKKVNQHTFELKDFSPNPSDEYCYKSAYSFIKRLKDESLIKYGTSEVFFTYYGDIIYNESEFIKKCIFAMRSDSSSIVSTSGIYPDSNLNKKRIIYQIHYSNYGELYWEIRIGFLELENKY